MKNKNHKALQLVIWATIMVAVIILSVVINKVSNDRDINNNVSEVVDIKVYDGSEKNPDIEGVQ